MELIDKFKAMRKLKGRNYKPRTRHLDENGWAKFTNRLFLESSPYLLQHAHNPVNWYPWCAEAFSSAKDKGLPVLLSVGYSTCHWCHVMENESFEDLEIAEYINENYISIKVDREERPDIDAIYMTAVQTITGQGGWPMTVWLAPDKKPFYGGTYFPARDGDRGAFMGFFTILKKLRESYDKSPEIIIKTSTEITRNIQKTLSPGVQTEKKAEVPLLTSVLKNAVVQIKKGFDEVNGGIKGAPKFPSSMPIRFLLRHYNKTRDTELLKIAEQTLLKMAQGGIYDHAGGGFHRYATDEKWLIPHFEKMLYDNALLVMAYLEGFQVIGNETFKQVAEETLRYVKRDMTSPMGGFFSASDADSVTDTGRHEEGYYFTWTLQELETLFGGKKAAIAAKYFDVTETGNFKGRSVLNIKAPADVFAEKSGMTENELLNIIADAKSTLYKKRNLRQPPLRDEKILTSWNGLMISAFAQAGRILGNPDYIATAKKAADFILNNMHKNNRLLRSYNKHETSLDLVLNPMTAKTEAITLTSEIPNLKDGIKSGIVFLDDYSFFIAGLIDLFEACHDSFWLKTAVNLDKAMSDLFEDRINGGFFMTPNDHEDMIARIKPIYDNAIPSGNSIAVMNLLRLSKLKSDKILHKTHIKSFTGENSDDDVVWSHGRYKNRAFKTIAAFSSMLESSPLALSEMIVALDFYQDL